MGRAGSASHSGCLKSPPINLETNLTDADTMIPTFAAIIPALNCAATIADVARDTRGKLDTILVIDDGSADKTGEIASRAGATVLRNDPNLGKGVSLRRGFEWCVENGISHAITIDGDGQHLSSQIPPLLKCATENPRAIVIGERVFDESIVAEKNLLGNRIANRWVEIACNESIPDTQSGFRVYPTAETLNLSTRANRFAFETEVLIRGVRAGMNIRSVPTEAYYPPADERQSHYRPFVDSVRIIVVVIGLILRIY